VGLVRSATAVAVAKLRDHLPCREDDDGGLGDLFLVVDGECDGLRLDELRRSEVAGGGLDDGGYVDHAVGVLGRLRELVRHQFDDGHPVVGIADLVADPAAARVVGLPAQLDEGCDEEARLPPAGADEIDAGHGLDGVDADVRGREDRHLAEAFLRARGLDVGRCGSGDECHADSGCSRG
jgi:hypothetical protein